ncbi:MAG: hypothetical protein P8L18_11880 [Verrucomicrobiota bacterium]|nr:hypothetical protein [Verrucomicrobiota bacterium]
MGKKKILFLGCNHDQIPYLDALKQRPYVIVGVDKNNQAPGKDLCHAFYNVGYDDYSGLLEVGKLENFTSSDKVFTAAAQFAHQGAARFSQTFGISYPKEGRIGQCLNKASYYQIFLALHVPIPKTWYVKNFNDLQKYLSQARDTDRFYLKSDLGKSPKYNYRFNKAGLLANDIFWGQDQFLDKFYLLQKEYDGIHLRINVYGERYNVFEFKTGEKTHEYEKRLKSLGVIGVLREVSEFFGLENWMIKYDIILGGHGYVVLDIGMDPPARLIAFAEEVGADFPNHYLDQYLSDQITYPEVFD